MATRAKAAAESAAAELANVRAAAEEAATRAIHEHGALEAAGPCCFGGALLL